MEKQKKNNDKETNKQDNTKKNTRIILGIIGIIILIVGVFFLGRISNSELLDSYEMPYNYNSETDDRYWNPEDGTKVISKSTNTSNNGIKGKIYKKVSLLDTGARVKAFEGLLPEGWTATIESNWNVVSSACPGLESVTITSPDGKCSIVIDSQQTFVENSQYAEGVNYEYYTTYLHYMDADTFVQYYIDNTYSNAILLKEFEDDNDILSQANAYTEIKLEGAKQDIVTLGASNYGVQISVNSIPATMSKRQYQIGNSYLEGSCVIVAIDTSLASKYVPTSNSRTWSVPYSIVYMADDKETFDKYYDDYNFIIANSSFTTDYYAMVEYVSSSIVNSYTSYYAAKSQAGLDAMNSYIDSNYSSTSSQSTNDKVMEMWDDYINEVDSYNTLDGTKIKTSMYNDTVAQNGDSFYVGSSTGVPSGYTELSKSY